MNSEINKKTPAFIYAKEFKLSKILGNLQAYKLATGEVGEAEKEEASKKHGDDLGAIYGSLITEASWNSSDKRKDEEPCHSGTSERRQRKRRRKRKQDKVDVVAEFQKTKRGENTTVISTTIDSQPLPLPDCLLDEDLAKGGNESSSEENDVDYFGLSGTSTSSKDTPEMSPQKKIVKNQEPSTTNINTLTTYTCWKCKRRGHLPEHCTVIVDNLCGTSSRQPSIKNNAASIDTALQDLYMQCRKLKNAKIRASCNECGNSSNLAHCFECRLTFCDGRGHLINHFLAFPTHNTVYSYKLQKLLKCSNRTCNIVDVTKLRTCSQCLSKTFDKNYSLVNATWSNRGLRSIINAITCSEHYQWHRMNCYNSFEEVLFNEEKLVRLKQEQNGLLSEFFF